MKIKPITKSENPPYQTFDERLEVIRLKINEIIKEINKEKQK